MFIVCHSLFTSVNSIEIIFTLSPNNNPGLMVNKPYFSTFKKNLRNKKVQKQKLNIKIGRIHHPSLFLTIWNHSWTRFYKQLNSSRLFTFSQVNSSSWKHLYFLIGRDLFLVTYQSSCDLLSHLCLCWLHIGDWIIIGLLLSLLNSCLLLLLRILCIAEIYCAFVSWDILSTPLLKWRIILFFPVVCVAKGWGREWEPSNAICVITGII